MISEFSFNSELKDNCLIIKTKGYINNTGGEKIAAVFESHHDNGVKKIVMNLAESKVVNSIGISYLIEMIDKLNQSDGKLIFTNLDPTIEKTFTIMGLFHFAEKAESIETALTMF